MHWLGRPHASLCPWLHGNLYQFRERVDVEFFHDFRTVRFYGLYADRQLFGNDAVYFSRDHAMHDFAFAVRQQREARLLGVEIAPSAAQ